MDDIAIATAGKKTRVLTEPAFTSGKNTDEYWREMLKLIHDEGQNLFQGETAFVRYLLDQLHGMGCDDPNIAIRILMTYSVAMMNNFRFNHKRNATMRRVLAPLESGEFVEQLDCLDFSEMTLVSISLNCVKLASALVRYDACDLVNSRSHGWKIYDAYENLGFFWYNINKTELRSSESRDCCLRKAERYMNVVSTWQCECSCKRHSTQSKVRRTCLTMRTLKALTLYRYENRRPAATDLASCMKLFFRTIPDPFIKKVEIEKFLRSSFFENKLTEDVIQGLIRDYAVLFGPECNAAKGPSSLKHLARLIIRKSCRKAGTLPAFLESLPIPKSLRKYVRADYY